jgi:hypothetical protein
MRTYVIIYLKRFIGVALFDPFDDTVWTRREIMPFLGMRRVVDFGRISRRQTNEFGALGT